MVDGLADAAFRLLVAGFASNVFDGFITGLPTAGSYTHSYLMNTLSILGNLSRHMNIIKNFTHFNHFCTILSFYLTIVASNEISGENCLQNTIKLCV